MTWGKWYWPIWLAFALITFGVPEVAALITNVNNTLSDFVWRILGVTDHQSVWQWSAARVLTLGVWLTVVTWLTWHFWLRIWR